MFRLVKKCKLLKEKSKAWNKFQFGNIFRQLRKVDDRLKSIQADILTNPLDTKLLENKICFLINVLTYYRLALNIGNKKQD